MPAAATSLNDLAIGFALRHTYQAIVRSFFEWLKASQRPFTSFAWNLDGALAACIDEIWKAGDSFAHAEGTLHVRIWRKNERTSEGLLAKPKDAMTWRARRVSLHVENCRRSRVKIPSCLIAHSLEI